jgi:DNA polymerase-3 subunit gamma/tau
MTLLEAIHAGKTAEVLQIVAELHDASKDLQRLCEELLLLLRDVMLLKATGDTSLLHCMADEAPALQKLAADSDMEQVMAQLNALQDCRERMGRAVNRRVELEMTLIQLCSPHTAAAAPAAGSSADVQALYERIALLESRAAVAPVAAPEVTKPQISPAPEPVPEVDLRKVKMEDFKPLTQWAEILEECGRLNPAVLGTLSGSQAVVNANVILIVAENPFFLTMFKDKQNAQSLGDAVEHIMGSRFVIRAKCSAAASRPRPVQEMLEKAQNSGIKTTAVT